MPPRSKSVPTPAWYLAPVAAFVKEACIASLWPAVLHATLWLGLPPFATYLIGGGGWILAVMAAVTALEKAAADPGPLPAVSGGAIVCDAVFSRRLSWSVLGVQAMAQFMVPILVHGACMRHGAADRYDLMWAGAERTMYHGGVPLFRVFLVWCGLGVAFVATRLRVASRPDLKKGEAGVPAWRQCLQMGVFIWAFTFPWGGPSLSMLSWLWLIRIYAQSSLFSLAAGMVAVVVQGVAGMALYEYMSVRRLPPANPPTQQ